MKRALVAAVSAVIVAAAGAAHADSINWGQWGLGTFGGTLSGVTTDGVDFTITSPNGLFEVLQQGSGWDGIFNTGDPVLWNGEGSGDDRITFATPISSLTLAAESNLYGTFNEYMFSYDSLSNLLDHPFVPGLTSTFAPGTAVSFTTTADGIAFIDVSTSNDGGGFGIGGGSLSAVPEPSTWAMLMLGFVGLGFAGYRAKARSAAFAA
jgi:PEP-CTERM motif